MIHVKQDSFEACLCQIDHFIEADWNRLKQTPVLLQTIPRIRTPAGRRSHGNRPHRPHSPPSIALLFPLSFPFPSPLPFSLPFSLPFPSNSSQRNPDRSRLHLFCTSSSFLSLSLLISQTLQRCAIRRFLAVKIPPADGFIH